MTEPYDHGAVEDRTMPVIVYVLYILGLTHGLTTIIGLIVAYVARDNAGPVMRSHYDWQIRTFWLSIGAFLIGGALMLIGIPLSFILIGVPLVMLGGLIFCAAWLWFAVRTVAGLIWAAQDMPCPRPYAVFL